MKFHLTKIAGEGRPNGQIELIQQTRTIRPLFQKVNLIGVKREGKRQEGEGEKKERTEQNRDKTAKTISVVYTGKRV